MITRAGIMFTELPDEEFDPALGIATGAGIIFGATGGVMEAALRTAAEMRDRQAAGDGRVPGGPRHRGHQGGQLRPGRHDGQGCRGQRTGQRGKLLDASRAARRTITSSRSWPAPAAASTAAASPSSRRSSAISPICVACAPAALYSEDEAMTLRKSHENPVVKELYEEYLGEPGSHLAHHILHTTYVKRGLYK